MTTNRFNEKKLLGISMPMVMLLGLLLAIVILFASIDPAYLRLRNVFAITQTCALLGMVAVGLYLTMLAGEFDLSSGNMVAVAGLITLLYGQDNLLFGIVCALAFAAVIGLLNALLMVWLSVSSLVVTRGMMMTLNGLAFWLAGGSVVNTDQFDLGFWLDEPILSVISMRGIITLAVFVAVALMLAFTRLGRDIRVAGSSR